MVTLNESLEPMRKRSSSATESSNNDRKPAKHLDISNNYTHNGRYITCKYIIVKYANLHCYLLILTASGHLLLKFCILLSN